MSTTVNASTPNGAIRQPFSAAGRGDATQRLRVEPPQAGRRRARVPWIILGVLLIVGCGLAVAVWAGGLADRDAVLGLARPVQRGDVLATEDLAVLRVALDGQVPAIGADHRGELVGQAVTASLPAGTVLSRDMLTAGPVLASGVRVLGLALDPGEYPVGSLRPGDEVMVVQTPPATGAAVDEVEAVILASAARIFAVEPVGQATASVLVSVAVDERTAPEIAAAASHDRIRLVLSGGGR